MNPVTNFEKWINSIATGTAPDIPPVTRFEHFLNKIRLAIARKSDITSGLPAVTAEDNDKVLTVVEGAWDKAVPSGGGGIFVVTTNAEYGESSITFENASKNYSEIKSAMLNNQIPILFVHAVVQGENESIPAIYSNVGETGNSKFIEFAFGNAHLGVFEDGSVTVVNS